MYDCGNFRIVDRLKNLVLKAGGFNIYPREIEDVRFKDPKVLEAAAVGVLVESLCGVKTRPDSHQRRDPRLLPPEAGSP